MWCFFFKDTAAPEIYTYCHTLSRHGALPIFARWPAVRAAARPRRAEADLGLLAATAAGAPSAEDRRVCCGGSVGHRRGQREGGRHRPLQAEPRAASPRHHDPARHPLAGSDHRAGRHHHHDAGHPERLLFGRRPRPAGALPRHRRSRGRGDRHQATLRGTAEGDLRMMAYALLFGFGCFGLGLLLNFYRLAKGPSLADRILALDTMVINSIALLILYGIPSDSAASRSAERRVGKEGVS